MNRAFRHVLLRLLMVSTAIAVPSMLVAQLVRAAGAPALQLRGAVGASSMLLAQSSGAAGAGIRGSGAPSSGNASSTSPIAAVLYTNGKAKVSWNGAEFEVSKGSYAYVGGETVQMAPGSIGLMQLSDGSSVYVCSNSSVQLTRSDDGAHSLDVLSGSSRFAFKPQSQFTVRVNGTEITQDSRAAAGGVMFEAEVQAKPDGGCVVCELAGNVKVSSGTSSSPAGGVGRVIEVAPASGRRAITTTPIPAAAMPVSMSAGGAAGPSFLCQCEDLQRKVEELAIAQAAETAEVESAQVAEAGPDAAIADADPTAPDNADPEPTSESAPQTPPETVSGPVVEPGPSSEPSAPPPVIATAPQATIAPPVAPPEAPPLALAEPGLPDPFDPNVLPPPAAGEPNEPVVVVAPPAVPSSGSGGGGVASPS